GGTYTLDMPTVENKEITNGTYNVPSITPRKLVAEEAQVKKYYAEYTAEKQTFTYEFTAPCTGEYSVYADGFSEGNYFVIQIYNAGGDCLHNVYGSSSYGLNDNFYISLNKGEEYTFKLTNKKYLGQVILNISVPKFLNIDSYSFVDDKIEYIGQKNHYYYTPSVTGKHRFGISNVNEGVYFAIKIYNAGGECIYNTYGNNTYGLNEDFSISLTAGQKYTIQVFNKKSYTGDYRFEVANDNDVGEIGSYYKINDSIQCRNQRNYYELTASYTGEYNFYFSDINDGSYYVVVVYNAGGKCIHNVYFNSSYSLNDGFSLSLTKGQTYYFEIYSKSEKYGSYAFNIGNYKTPLSIDDYVVVKDSIQYLNQNNVYTFTAEYSETCQMFFSGIQNGKSIKVTILSPSGKKLYDKSVSSNAAIEFDVTKNNTYTIIVQQAKGLNYNYSFEFYE
ncbi:MAG: hypothetical protein MJ153_05880, partial [Clostridia bacterium]|nr:hypothetical protein [Clostridia bacterium]